LYIPVILADKIRFGKTEKQIYVSEDFGEGHKFNIRDINPV